MALSLTHWTWHGFDRVYVRGPGVNAVLAERLLVHCGSVALVLSASEAELRKVEASDPRRPEASSTSAVAERQLVPASRRPFVG